MDDSKSSSRQPKGPTLPVASGGLSKPRRATQLPEDEVRQIREMSKMVAVDPARLELGLDPFTTRQEAKEPSARQTWDQFKQTKLESGYGEEKARSVHTGVHENKVVNTCSD